MSFLATVSTGRVKRPYAIFMHGVEGAGKSTFASQAPHPIFLATERGTDNINTSRGALLRSLSEVIAALEELINVQHPFKTVVLDTMNGLEALLHKDMVAKEPKADVISDTKGGYGKGLLFASSELEKLIPLFERLRDEKGMNIILIAHTKIKDFHDPSAQEAYQKYRVNMDERAADKFKQWADAVFFATTETLVSKDQKTKKTKAFSDGQSIIYTQARAGWDAKNRYGLPLKIDLSWDAFIEAVEAANPNDTGVLLEEIEGLIEQFDDEVFVKKVRETVEKYKLDSNGLTSIRDKLTTRLQDAK